MPNVVQLDAPRSVTLTPGYELELYNKETSERRIITSENYLNESLGLLECHDISEYEIVLGEQPSFRRTEKEARGMWIFASEATDFDFEFQSGLIGGDITKEEAQ